MDKKTSTLSNGLIWFGAGVSIAEIITGTYIASLGFAKGILAIIIGHIIGGAMMYAAGMIGGKTEKSAMETVKMSFGRNGGRFFSLLNVLQLVGWTAIMIYDGALAADGIFSTGHWIWALVIGVLIIVWILIGITNLGKLNTVAMAALFILSIILFKVIFFGKGGASAAPEDGLTFGGAVELSVAMPLSWLPLISDYTREAEKPTQATAVSVVIYNIVSIFMYAIGMGAVIYTGEYDIASILVKAGLGIVGLLIVVFSTVTTTFLDAYSAGVSSVSIWDKISEKWAAIAVSVIGIIAAIAFPMDDITNFLYLIGSVFAPMIAIQIADFFILKNASEEEKGVSIKNIVIWVIGFVVYRFLMKVDIVVGNTLPDMIITVVICVVTKLFVKNNATENAKNNQNSNNSNNSKTELAD